MDASTIVARLREHENELKTLGIEHLLLHGSYVRSSATASSDVDVIADFDRTKKLSLIGRAHSQSAVAGHKRDR